MKSLIAFSIWATGAALFPSASWAQSLGEPLENLPVQDGGRIKPYDTFARESLRLIYGKETFDKRPATEIVFTWMLVPDHWMEKPLIELRHSGLKEALKITSPDTHFSPQSLFKNERIALLVQELATARNRQEKLNPYYQAVQRLENQLGLFQALRSGRALRVAPKVDSDAWLSIAELDERLAESFSGITKGFVDSVSLSDGQSGKSSARPDYVAAVKNFMDQARSVAPEKYADMNKITWEVHLNKFHPFKWAWVAYALSLLALVISANGYARTWPVMWLFLGVGFFLHTYGMVLRMYLAGRPPVSNMYETVVWVPWGTLLFAVILERVQKNKLIIGAALLVGILCLRLTDLASAVLDSSLNPLEPVLRSTFWLSTHVLIITISYAAFFLAFALGDILLFMYLRDEKKYAQSIANGSHSIYRAIQIGVVLLAAGIILGGIWADYSWGRFWGWDPKETWALIALLFYLAILHGRLVGWVKNFQLAATAVVAFSFVIMAWYGVNYVLGAGLHSYGFGAGGVEYVAGFVVIQLLFVAYVTTVRYQRLK